MKDSKGLSGWLYTGVVVVLIYFIVKFAVKAAVKGVEFLLFAGIVALLVGIYSSVKNSKRGQ